MDKQEFFLLIPGIIYGVAIVDLLKIFSHKKNYIEIVGWGIYTMMAVIFTWTELYKRLDLITDETINFYLIIIQAIMFAMLARLITPEEKDEDTKSYFFQVRKPFFILASVLISYGILLHYYFYDDRLPVWLRLFAIVVYLVVAYTNKFWLRILLLVLAMLLLLMVIFTSAFY